MPTYEEYLGMADKADKAGDEAAARDLMSLARQAQKNTSPPPVPEGAPMPEVGMAEGVHRAMGRGVPVAGSFLDEIRAAIKAGDTMVNEALAPYIPDIVKENVPDFLKKQLSDVPGATFAEKYENAVAEERAKDKAFDEKHPVVSTLGQVAGGIVGTGALMATAPGAASKALGVGGKTLPGRMAAGAASGGAIGGAHGFGIGEGSLEDRLMEAGKGAFVGTALGGAFPVLAAGLGRAWGAFRNQAAPALKNLKTQSQRLYKKADKINLVINKDKVQDFVDNLPDVLREEGYHPRIHSKTAVALDELGVSAADDLTLREAQNLRAIAQAAQKSTEPEEQRMGGILVDMLDDFLESVSPDDVISGDPKLAANILSQARNLWGRYRKGETIEKLLQLAELNAPNFSGSGAENAIRTEFRNLAKQLVRDPRKAKLFTAAERKAIEKVAKGGPIANLLRMLGKFAPTGVVSSTLSGGAGYAVGGPAGAVALPTIGFAARAGATKATLGNARAASELVRRGAPAPGVAAAKTLADYAQGTMQGTVPALSQQATPYLPSLQRTSP